MARFGISRVPRDVRAACGGERVLAYAPVAGGGYLVATPGALRLPASAGLARLPWDQVVRAGWAPPRLELTVQPVLAAAPVELVLELTEARALAEMVHDRVTASIVAERHVLLTGSSGARFVARRTESDQVRWSVLFDKGLDPADPALRARADEELRVLRASWGV